MNSLVEIHDSTLAAITFVDRDLVLRLAPAYLHRSSGQPGVDHGSGWLQDLDLVISEAVAGSLPLELPSDLWNGSISIDGTRWDNIIPLPLIALDAVSFTAVTNHGERLVVRGAGASIVIRGDMRYVEEYPGSTDA